MSVILVESFSKDYFVTYFITLLNNSPANPSADSSANISAESLAESTIFCLLLILLLLIVWLILLLSFLLSHLLYFPLKKLSLFFSVLKLFLLTCSNLLHCWIIVVKNTWDEHVEVGFCCSYLVWLRYRQGMMFPAKTNPFWQEQLNFLHTAYTYSYMYGDQLRSIIILKSARGLSGFCDVIVWRSYSLYFPWIK